MTTFPRASCTLVSGWRWSPIGLGRSVRLDAPYTILTGARRIAIPAGYLWDGPSFGWFTAATETWSLVHDWLYREADRAVWTRTAADSLARRIAEEHGSWWGSADWQWRLVEPVLARAWSARIGAWSDAAEALR